MACLFSNWAAESASEWQFNTIRTNEWIRVPISLRNTLLEINRFYRESQEIWEIQRESKKYSFSSNSITLQRSRIKVAQRVQKILLSSIVCYNQVSATESLRWA